MITARPVRRTLRLLAGVAATVVLVTGAAASPSVAAPTPGTSEGDALLPTVDQAAELYPGLEGGSRRVEQDSAVFVRTENCIRQGAVDGGEVWYAVYEKARGRRLPAVPFAAAVEFPSVAGAEDYLDRLRDDVRRCEGARGTGERRTVSHRLAAPDAGEESLTWSIRTSHDFTGPRDVVRISSFVRTGNLVSWTDVSRYEKRPSIATAHKWAQVALDTFV